MADYQEAKKAGAEKKEPLKSPKVQTKSSSQKAKVCPNCNASNPEEAVFCSECGFGLGQALFCPNCGAPTSPGADICPVCKTWLLEGKCKFCYAELLNEASFCPECGNPQGGIKCPKCGKLSIFDFCADCGSPLTEGALEALKLAKDDPEAQELVKAIEQNTSIESEIADLEALINSEPEPEAQPLAPERKSLFSDRQLASIIKTGANREAAAQRRAEEEKKAEEESKKQERLAKIRDAKARKEALEKEKINTLAALNEAARKFAHKTFLSHQEARRWHNARRHPNAVGWLCNYTNTVHMYPEGANGCDQPGLGGCDYFGETIAVEIKGPS